MLGVKTSIYYRICWGIVTPAFMMAVLIYTLWNYTPLQYNGYTYQTGLYGNTKRKRIWFHYIYIFISVLGWCISGFGIGQLLIWGVGTVWNYSDGTICERIKKSFKPQKNWGPLDPSTLKEYQLFKTEERTNEMFKKTGFCHKIYDNIFS